MIVWREKLIATAVHFAATLGLAAIAAALIFLVWFPPPFATMIGGTELFMLVVGCDLALGPLMSLVIYNSRKSRRELVTDYSIVGLVQIAALVYGVLIVAGTRPVYVAFSSDRYEVVTARDISEAELAAATNPEYQRLPWLGPKLVSVVVPPAEQQEAMFQSLQGNEEHQRPKFFAPLPAQLDRLRAKARKMDALVAAKPEAKAQIEAAAADSGVPAERLAWLAARHRKGFWTVLVDTSDGRPAAWVPLDPL